MLKIWTDHLPEEEKEEFTYEIRASSKVLHRLEEIVKQKQELSNKAMRKGSFLERINLKESIHNELGYQRAMDDILTTLKDRNKND